MPCVFKKSEGDVFTQRIRERERCFLIAIENFLVNKKLHGSRAAEDKKIRFPNGATAVATFLFSFLTIHLFFWMQKWNVIRKCCGLIL